MHAYAYYARAAARLDSVSEVVNPPNGTGANPRSFDWTQFDKIDADLRKAGELSPHAAMPYFLDGLAAIGAMQIVQLSAGNTLSEADKQRSRKFAELAVHRFSVAIIGIRHVPPPMTCAAKSGVFWRARRGTGRDQGPRTRSRQEEGGMRRLDGERANGNDVWDCLWFWSSC